MGLDAVELVIALEEEFGISIPNHVAERMRTPRDVIDYVTAVLAAPARSPGCLTQHAFHRVRASLLRGADVARRELRPGARLAALVPAAAGRPAVWGRLVIDFPGVRWPGLVRPAWLTWLLLAAVASAGAAAWISPPAPLTGRMAAAVAVAALVGVLAAILTRPLRTEFPPELATVGDVARRVASSPPDPAVDDSGWTRERIALAVRRIVAGFTDVTDFTDDSEFVRDLKLD